MAHTLYQGLLGRSRLFSVRFSTDTVAIDTKEFIIMEPSTVPNSGEREKQCTHKDTAQTQTEKLQYI